MESAFDAVRQTLKTDQAQLTSGSGGIYCHASNRTTRGASRSTNCSTSGSFQLGHTATTAEMSSSASTDATVPAAATKDAKTGIKQGVKDLLADAFVTART